MCVCVCVDAKTPKLQATPAESNSKYLLTLSPELSLALSSCIWQLTCDRPVSRPSGEPIWHWSHKVGHCETTTAQEGTNNNTFFKADKGSKLAESLLHQTKCWLTSILSLCSEFKWHQSQHCISSFLRIDVIKTPRVPIAERRCFKTKRRVQSRFKEMRLLFLAGQTNGQN